MAGLRDVLLARADDDRPALLAGEARWSWREYVEEASRRAHVVAGLLDDDRPPHVGLLSDNTPELAFALAAAGLGGHVAVGLNTTRRGASLAADVATADCQVVLADPRLLPLLEGVDLGGARVLSTDDPEWVGDVASAPATPPEAAPGDASLFMLIFTSGTSGEPKAVRITHEKVTHPGGYLVERLGLSAEDVFYVAMPLFHSNAVMAGWGPAVVAGATVALAERFSASGFLADVRHYGATYLNYVGKPLSYVLATPERPDDAENPLRLAFGNEAGDRDIAAFSRRFGCTVVDGFGSTENAVVVSRVPGTPPGSLGQPLEGVAVLDPATGQECPRAVFGPDGRVTNLDEATGELVNTLGAGQFAGYYNDEAATAARMRGGMYWSGDLAYRDAEGYVYFAGRTADWLRVDGENLAAAPVERILVRHPALAQAAVYAVPDPSSGDQLVAALVLVDDLTPEAFEHFLDAQADLGTKSRPRFVRVLDDLPRTATNKVLKRELRSDGLTGVVWERDERGTSYRASTRVERDLAAPRHEVYAALLDPAAVARWKVPSGMDCVVHELDDREGGAVRVSLTYRSADGAGKTSAQTDTYRGRFDRLVPDELVEETDEFETDDPAMTGAMTSTIRLTDAPGGGTRLAAVHTGLPRGVRPADNVVGWDEALDRLAALVERGSAGDPQV